MNTNPSNSQKRALRRGQSILPLLAVALLVLDAITLAVAVTEGPYPAFVPLGSPTAFKNLYVHVPVAIASYATFTLAFLSAIMFLWRGKDKYRRLAHSAIVAGIIYGAATLITGSIWAKESWGVAWNWDPRETGVLFLWVAYLVYFGIKAGIKDPDVASRVTMAYAVAAYVAVPLSFLLPYIMPSLHPVVSETAKFIESASYAVMLFPARMALVTVTSLVLTYLLYSRAHVSAGMKRPLEYAALLLLASGFIVLGLNYQSLTGTPYYIEGASPGSKVSFKGVVLEGELKPDGTLELDVLSGRSKIKVEYKGEPPIRPVVVEFRGEEKVTLENHNVYIEGTVSEDETVVASRLKVIAYWGVPVNALVYALSVFALIRLSCTIKRS